MSSPVKVGLLLIVGIVGVVIAFKIIGTILGGLVLGTVPEGVLIPLLVALLLVSSVKVWRHD